MKRTLIDKFVGYFSPSAELRRARARKTLELFGRSYDAATSFKTDDWLSAKSTSPNGEIEGNLTTMRDRSRDAVRNSPWANRALNVIVSNVIGHGIHPNIRGRNKTQTKKINEEWKKWANSTACDKHGKHNFYGLQALAMRSVVEGGEIIALSPIERGRRNKPNLKIKLLESDFIDHSKNTEPVVQGVVLGENNEVEGFYLYPKHPGDDAIESNLRTDVDEIHHVYRTDRPGQVRGVPWSHPVLKTLGDLADYQNATIVGRKIAACFSAFITQDPTDQTLSSSDLATRRELETTLEPATIRYLKPGENVEFASPPRPEGYSDFIKETLRAVASGYGISYEALTGDYSQVNFSSGRMGHIEFQRSIDNWRWNMFIPQFCDPIFKRFLDYLAFKGIDVSDVDVEWVPPARVMIDPTKEITAAKEAVRCGFTTLKNVIREQGNDPDKQIQEIAEERDALKELGVTLDSTSSENQEQGDADSVEEE